ncbi:hypothetical protein E9993_17530 [Labilibacter sediminis]|nr:hypothetical protein E9993_17530 [Labilibacter sediminis]
MLRFKIIFVFLLTTSMSVLYAQYQTDSIQITKKLGTVYTQNGQNLTPRQLLEITQSNPDAYKAMKLAKINYDTGLVFGFLGGGLIGFPIGSSLGGGDPNWTLAAVGAGLIAISIPLSSAYNMHAKTAVSIYNSGLNNSTKESPRLNLFSSSNSIGLRLTF